MFEDELTERSKLAVLKQTNVGLQNMSDLKETAYSCHIIIFQSKAFTSVRDNILFSHDSVMKINLHKCYTSKKQYILDTF